VPTVKCPTPEDSSLAGPGQLRRSGRTTLWIHGYRLPVKHRALLPIGQDPGDTLLLYTDGVTEAMNAENEEFGVERLQAIFLDEPPTSAQHTNEAVFRAVHSFADGTPQSDDITCLTISRIPV